MTKYQGGKKITIQPFRTCVAAVWGSSCCSACSAVAGGNCFSQRAVGGGESAA